MQPETSPATLRYADFAFLPVESAPQPMRSEDSTALPNSVIISWIFALVDVNGIEERKFTEQAHMRLVCYKFWKPQDDGYIVSIDSKFWFRRGIGIIVPVDPIGWEGAFMRYSFVHRFPD